MPESPAARDVSRRLTAVMASAAQRSVARVRCAPVRVSTGKRLRGSAWGDGDALGFQWRRLIALAALAGLAVVAAVRALELVPAKDGRIWGLVGPLGGLGVWLPARTTALLMVAMAVCYAMLVWAGRAVPRAPAFGLALALLVLFVLVPPHIHRDVFAYVAYGRMAARHINPYTQGPSALGHDPVNGYYDPTFSDLPSKYGPLFTLLSAALAPLGVLGAAWGLKILTGLAGVALLTALDRSAPRPCTEGTRALVLVGLNPLWLVYAVANGHNDVLMSLGLGVAAVALTRRREAGGATAGVVAAAVKPAAVVAVPMLLLAARSRRALAGTVAVAGAITALSVALFGSPMALARTLAQHEGGGGRHSVPGLLRHATGIDLLGHGGRYLLLAAFIAAYAAIGVLGYRRRLSPAAAAGWAMAAVLCCSTIVYAWYVVWLLPLAALSRNAALRSATVVLTFVLTALWPARHLLHL